MLGARRSVSSSAADFVAGATTTRRWSRSSRPIRATSSSRSTRTSCSRSPSGSCASGSGGACGSSCDATCSAASCRASSFCRSSGTTPESGGGSSDPPRRVRRRERRLHAHVSESVLARLHVVVRTEPGALRDVDVGRDRSPVGRGDARVVGRPARRADRAARRRAGGAIFQPLRRRVPAGYRDDFPALGGARHPADRAARPGRRSRHEPLRPARVARPTTWRSSWFARDSRSSFRTCCQCWSTWACGSRDERPFEVTPRDSAAGLDLRLRPRLRRRCGARQSTSARASSRTRSPRCGAGRPRTTGSTGSSWARADCARDHGPARDREVPAPGRQHFSQAYMEDALAAHPSVARRSSSCSRSASIRPRRDDATRGGASSQREIEEALDAVASLDEDRILRSFLARGPRDAAHELLPAGRRRRAEAVPGVQARPAASPTCPRRGRCSRSSSTRRASRACTCAPARSRAAASAGPTAGRTSAPRSSG